MACAYSAEFEKAYQALLAGAKSPIIGSSDQPDSEDARGLLEARPSWARVFLLKADRVSLLSRYAKFVSPEVAKTIREAARQGGSFAYAARAPGSGPVFVLAAESNDDAERLVREFLGLNAMFSGFALRSQPRSL
jgi:hypothetical protein